MTPEYFKAPPNCGTGRGDPPKGAWGGFQPPLPKLCFGARFDPGPDGLGGFWEPPNTSRVTQERDPLEGTLMSWGPPQQKTAPPKPPTRGGALGGLWGPGVFKGFLQCWGLGRAPPRGRGQVQGGWQGASRCPRCPHCPRSHRPHPAASAGPCGTGSWGHTWGALSGGENPRHPQRPINPIEPPISHKPHREPRHPINPMEPSRGSPISQTALIEPPIP